MYYEATKKRLSTNTRLEVGLIMKTANVAFISSISGTSYGWFVETAPVLQWLAFAVAIVSGIYAIRVYRKKLKDDLK